VLYFLLTGRTVFEGDSLPHMLMQIVSDPPPPLRRSRPDVPEGVEACVLRMLAKDRTQRFQSAAEVWAALKPFAVSGDGAAQAVPVRSAVFARYSGSTTPGTPVPVAGECAPAVSAESGALPTSTLHKRIRTLGLALPVLVVALGAAIFVVARGKEPDDREPTPVLAAEAQKAEHAPAAMPSAQLTVRVSPAQAALRVDGQPVGNPYAARLPVSDASTRIEASLAGYDSLVRELRVDHDQQLDLELVKTPEPQLARDVPSVSDADRRHRRKAERALPSAEPASATQLEPSAPASTSDAIDAPATPASPAAPAPEGKARDIKRIRI
jgi:serine/threonine-protein kinase